MSKIATEKDGNRSVAASDFVQLDQPDEVPGQEEQQSQHEHPHGLHQNPFNLTMDTGSTTTRNYEHELKEQKLMIANLEAKVKNIELCALKENAEQKANYEDLETKIAKILTSQNIKQQKHMEQLKDEFSKKLADQQKQMMAQFQAQNNSLERKLKEQAEQQAQMGKKNEFEEIIHANQQQVEKFRKEMDEKCKQVIGSNQMKLDYMWSHLMNKSKILANPKGSGWNILTNARISECGLNATHSGPYEQFVFATEGYAISPEQCRKDNFQFPGTIVFYFEVTTPVGFKYSSVGFTDGGIPIDYEDEHVGRFPNSYGLMGNAKTYGCRLAGKWHAFESPIQACDLGAVFGCGILLNSKNELAVFFTLNGTLLGKQTPIKPTVDLLYPTVRIAYASVFANFGDDLVAKPFKFDTDKCPGLVFE